MSSYVASWGIIGCGWISSMFVKDLCVEREDSTEISHSIVAVGSRDLKKAQIFVDEFCPKGSTAQARNPGLPKPAAFGSYEEVFNHKDVDIIYIGTLNSGHYSDAKAALLAGKNVLVEKPACLNAAEWRDLTGIAVEKKLFLMEDVPDSHRNFALETAGGVMYDLGPYTVLCALLALYHHPDNSRSKPDKVFGNMVKARTGVDLSTTISMEFPKLEATALLTASFAYNSPKDERCVIIGTQGEIVLNDGLSRITKMTIKRYDQEPTFRPTRWQENEVIEKPLPGFGLMFEADAVAKSIRNEELQNSRMPHDETAMVLEIFDQVRQQNGYTLPDGVEEISK
ncbi:hypothetical protein I302_104652 [Kwoniella bestiolae CBS 10118]|uniref:D-xylose 1-dehydrogenase (NADP(+), D-xylono-1,5-lactone-forming) n=1 Tax=Kwoniella bestiolae CBS 10118 TaxID=1296100 RepID=A0AAJ8K7V7_9TREE